MDLLQAFAKRLMPDDKPLDLSQIMETVEPELSDEGERIVDVLMKVAGFGVSLFGTDDNQESPLSPECNYPYPTIEVLSDKVVAVQYNVEADTILDMVYQVPRRYRPGAVFVMCGETVAQIMRYCGPDGQYLGEVLLNRLMGCEIIHTKAHPVIADISYLVVFGDAQEVLRIMSKGPTTLLPNPIIQK